MLPFGFLPNMCAAVFDILTVYCCCFKYKSSDNYSKSNGNDCGAILPVLLFLLFTSINLMLDKFLPLY